MFVLRQMRPYGQFVLISIMGPFQEHIKKDINNNKYILINI